MYKYIIYVSTLVRAMYNIHSVQSIHSIHTTRIVDPKNVMQHKTGISAKYIKVLHRRVSQYVL